MPIPPRGTWRIVQTAKFDKYGDAIEQLRDISVADINVSEDTVYEGREADADRYAQWLKEGQTPPPIRAAELENGKFQISDGHRRLLAHKKAGRLTILVWVAPIADTGLKSFEGKMIPTDLTHQLAIKAALKNNFKVKPEVLAEYPLLSEENHEYK
ncbi:MAG TPA: ParB/Srx family N-terminal domain-containing protein [Pyrinomonadaceae bacterium]|nr:ParB/Srx family N-terminal domain-containing protein [Pyrinomonadaceae bacterium]